MNIWWKLMSLMKTVVLNFLHRISLTINFTSFLTQCTMEYGVAEMPSVRALHTQKKTRNQRNWNVEQLNMQCNWIGFSSAFVYLLQIETHIRARKYHMHGELIGAWLRSFECARTSKRNRSNHFPSLWSPKAGRKSNVQFVFLYSSLLLLRHSNHKYFFCVCSGCIRFLCMSSAPKTGTISNMKSNVCSKNHHTKWWTFYEFQGKSGF